MLLLKPPFVRDLSQTVDKSSIQLNFKPGGVNKESRGQNYNLRLLADKAFPNLEDAVKKQLSLDRYLFLLRQSGKNAPRQ